jgi:prepilin signal peptidase PulO-like enzyme (type II secretory pathway)
VTALWAAVAAAMGAAAASFGQLAVDRAGSGRQQARLREPSRCPHCRAPVRPWHVLPVAGFLLLAGRCRVCRAAIGFRHLAGELTVGALWAMAVVGLGLRWWLPLVLLAPVLLVLLTSRAVRGAGCRLWWAAVLPPAGAAVLALGVGAALAGRPGLYLACGAVGAAALLLALRLTVEQPVDRLSQTPAGAHLPGV